MQRYTSVANVIDGDLRSFPECGGISVDALLMSEDVKHVFNLHSSDDDDSDTDKLPLLLDKILHCSLSDVVQYISSQLTSFTNSSTTSSSAVAAAAANDDDDDDDEEDASAPPVKRQRTTMLNGSWLTDVKLAGTAVDELESCTDSARDDNDNDQAKSSETQIACSCQALLSSSSSRSSSRVFCKDCYQRTTAYDFSELPLVVLHPIGCIMHLAHLFIRLSLRLSCMDS